MIADVVGYSRLSQLDEEGTRARFQANLKDIFEPRIAAHHGRLVKTMGDGIPVEFQSVINALRCAVDIQRTETELNAGAPADERLEFRIAINLGDVIVEGDDIHGNGVNIADRLQALARPGGVVISGTAYDHVTNHLDVGYEFLGEQRVKNIAEPVRVYGVLTGLTSPAPAAAQRASEAATRRWLWPAVAAALVVAIAGGAAWWRPWAPSPAPPAAQVAPAAEQADNSAAAVDQAASTPASPATSAPSEKPSLVVLPFDNLSDDKEQGYLADGITEDLTTELARIPDLFVISRNAAFTYKGKDVPPAKIAEELGVRYLLEGSIRRVGDDIRINAQLIDGESSGHLSGLGLERHQPSWQHLRHPEGSERKLRRDVGYRCLANLSHAARRKPRRTRFPDEGDHFEKLVAADFGGQRFEHFNHPDTDILVDGVAHQIKATDSTSYVNSSADHILSSRPPRSRASPDPSTAATTRNSKARSNSPSGAASSILDTTVDAVLTGVGGLTLIDPSRDQPCRHQVQGRQGRRCPGGLGVAATGTVKSFVDTAELGYKALTSRPSRFVGRMAGRAVGKVVDRIDRKLSDG